MNSYVALLRGINVGGHNSLPMAELAAILEKLSLRNVNTYIQSGNVVFQSKKKPGSAFSETISSTIKTAKGFRPELILFSAAEFEAAINENPFDTSNGKLLHFFFLQGSSKSADLHKLTVLKTSSEEFKLTEGVFYFLTPDGIGKSKLARKVEQILKVPVTGRNWNTVKEIQQMIGRLDI